MAKKLYGTDPDQVPTNADLGTIAYQDSKNTVLENAYVNAKGADGLEMGEDYTSRNNSSRLFFNSNVSGGNWTIFNNSGTLKMQSGAEAGSTSGNYTAFTLTTTNAVFGANAVFSSGYGIDFSATGNGSGTMTSELLDDYEEGNWSPALSYGGTSATLTSSTGQYVKIGRLVHVWLMIQVGNLNSGSGSIELSGLPYSSSGNMVYYHGNIQGNAEMNLPTGAGSVMPYVTGGTSTARFLYMTNSTHNDVTSTHFPAPITVYGQMTYSTAT
jgi:hypothetical protein